MGANDGRSYTLTGHVASVPDFDYGGSSLTDLPLGGGVAASPNTSCSFRSVIDGSIDAVYLQEGSFAIDEDRFTLRLIGGRWSDGAAQTLEVSGLAVPGDGTVWSLYPDGAADQRYFAVFAPKGRGPSPLTILIPTRPNYTKPISECYALRFSGAAADQAWGTSASAHPLIGAQGLNEIKKLPLVVSAGRYGSTYLNGGQLSLAEDGVYEFMFENQHYPLPVGPSTIHFASSTGRYATTGSTLVFDYDLPSISVGLQSADGSLTLESGNAAPAPSLKDETLLFGP